MQLDFHFRRLSLIREVAKKEIYSIHNYTVQNHIATAHDTAHCLLT